MVWREGRKDRGGSAVQGKIQAQGQQRGWERRKGQVSEVGVRREEQRESLYGVVIIKTLAGP